MQLWQDGLVALLAAIGLASLMWMAVRAVLFARPARRESAVALIPAQGDGEPREEQVHALTLMSAEQGIIGAILLVDCGLTEEGRQLCRLLTREDRAVVLCGRDEIGRYLT